MHKNVNGPQVHVPAADTTQKMGCDIFPSLVLKWAANEFGSPTRQAGCLATMDMASKTIYTGHRLWSEKTWKSYSSNLVVWGHPLKARLRLIHGYFCVKLKFSIDCDGRGL